MNRPISPHLQIYKLPITAILSIMHRATGAFLFFGTIVLAWMFVFMELNYQNCLVEYISNHFIFSIFLFAWASCLSYHLFNGVRHLLWDALCCFSLKATRYSNAFVIVASVIASFLMFVKVFVK